MAPWMCLEHALLDDTWRKESSAQVREALYSSGALPLSYARMGAGDGIRTRNIQVNW